MKFNDKTKEQLIEELAEMRQRITELEKLETEHKKSKKALRESEERYRAVVEDQIELICRFYRDGTYIFVNDIFCRFFGKSKAELIGRKWFPDAHADDLEMIKSKLLTMTPSNPVVFIENRVFSGDGVPRWMQFVNRGFYDQHGNLLEIQSIGRDITERKKAEEELQKAKDTLENMVNERTAELESTVEHLQEEINKRKKIEEKLKDSERKYCYIADNAISGITITTLNGDFLYTNDAFARILEYDSTEEIMKDKTMTKYVDPGQREAAGKILKEKGRIDNYEIDLISKTGQIKNILISSVLEGDIIISVIVDISRRKHAEDALRRSEKWLNSLLDQLDEAVLSISKDRVITYVNRTMEDMFGYSRDEFIGQSTRILHVDDKHYMRFGKILKTAFEKNRPMIFEYEGKRKNGEVFPTEHIVSFLKDDEGNSIGFVGVIRDITEHRKAEAALKIKDRAMESSINAISIAGPESNLTYVNSSFLKMWGYDNEKEVLGRSALEFWQDKNKAADVINILNERGNCLGEMVARRKDGAFFNVQLSANMVRDDNGMPICIMASFLDVSDQKKAEQQLKDSERKYRDIVDNTLVGVVITTLKGDVCYVNDAFVRMLEYGSGDELMKEKAVTRYKNRHQRETAVKMLMEEGRLDNYEIDFITKTGQVKNILVSSVLEGDLITTLIVDITERRKMEEKLRENEERLSSFMDSATDGFILFDEELNYLEMNRAALSITGLDKKDVIGKNILDMVPDVKESGWYDKYKKVIKTGEPVFFSDIIPHTEVGNKNIEIKAFRVGTGLGIIFSDITERKEIERALLNEKQRLEEVTGHANCCLFLLDDQTRVIYANNVAQEWFGPLDQIKDNFCWNVFNIKDPEKECSSLKVLKTGEIGRSEICTRLSSGEEKYLYEIASPLKDKKNNIYQIIVVITDITELKKAEVSLRNAKQEIEAWNRELEKRVKEKTDELVKSQAQLIQSEKLSAMGQMAGGLAHELNSPLAGLLPMLEQYRNKAKEGTKEYNELSLMHKACEHMAKIVRDFSAFSRESKGEFSELNLNKLIDDTLGFSASRIKQKGIQIIKEYKDTLPEVKGERTELQQVVLNMITNALDAMSDGGELTIRTDIAEDKNNVIMEFIDNGAGLEKEYLGKIFDPFYTTKRPGKGTGLGLSVSYKIIEKHGGNISVESEPGKGTKFTIYLPADKSGDT